MQAKSDALRKNLLGGQIANMVHHKGGDNNAAAQAANPLSKLFGGRPQSGGNPMAGLAGALSAAKAAKNNPLASMTAGAGGLGALFGGLGGNTNNLQ